MINKLRKKLMVLFLTFTMIIFSLAMFLMMSNAIVEVRDSEMDYTNNIADGIIKEAWSGTQIDTAYLSHYDCYIKISDEKNNYESPVAFLFTEAMVKQLKNEESILYEYSVIDGSANREASRTVHSMSFENDQKYYVLHSRFTAHGKNEYNLIIAIQQSSYWQIISTYCSWYPLLWLGIFILMYFASRFLIGKAIQPIEATMKSQKEFIASASHELKAPLAVIQVNAETLELENEMTGAAQKQKIILDECVRMSNLIKSLLSLASSDSGSWKMDLRENDVDPLLIETWELFSQRAQKAGIQLDLDIGEHYPKLRCDKERIMQTLGILIDNAIVHSKNNSSIQMGARMHMKQIVFYVIDHGCGIADAEKEKVFERFYTGDASRTNKAHYGLGLSIAKEIINLHQGNIILIDTPNGGCTFEIHIPLEKAS